MRSRGASDASFSGDRRQRSRQQSCRTIGPANREVQRDQPLLVDWGAVYKGYCSDLTRTLLLGRVSPRIKQIYKVVLEAQLAAIDFLRPA